MIIIDDNQYFINCFYLQKEMSQSCRMDLASIKNQKTLIHISQYLKFLKKYSI